MKLLLRILGYFDLAEQRETIKRLERMNAKNLISIAELQDERDGLIVKLQEMGTRVANHFETHICERVSFESDVLGAEFVE